MDLERLIENTLALQRIPAPTFHEEQRGEFLHNAFLLSGVSAVEMDNAGNVYGPIEGGSAAPTIVTAHLDSVFPPSEVVPAERRGNRLYGPGVGDNAVAVAALIELAFDLPALPLAGPVWLVGNVAEEGLGNLLGMQHVVERFGADAGAYVSVEGMALGHIYHRGLPVRRFRFEARTQGGHAWIHAGRPSAIHCLLSLGRDLVAIPLEPAGSVSLNVGRIEGGTSVNTIAAVASCEVDLRANEEPDLDRLVRRVEAVVAAHDGDTASIRMTAIGHRPSGHIEPDHPLVRAAVGAATEAGIGRPSLESGSTDASLPLSVGLPAVCVGLTRGGGAHSGGEFIELDPLAVGYEALKKLIVTSLELSF